MIMNREIKFRGKRKSSGLWIYGSLVKLESMAFILTEEALKETPLNMIGSAINHNAVDCVGHYTGLHDKNGKEIYEGDIVKAPLLDPIFEDIIKDAFDNAVIEYTYGAFGVCYYGGSHKIYLQDLADKIEVIGNKFDNPELIKED